VATWLTTLFRFELAALGLENLKGIILEMIEPDPAKRITAAQVAKRLDKVYSSLIHRFILLQARFQLIYKSSFPTFVDIDLSNITTPEELTEKIVAELRLTNAPQYKYNLSLFRSSSFHEVILRHKGFRYPILPRRSLSIKTAGLSSVQTHYNGSYCKRRRDQKCAF